MMHSSASRYSSERQWVGLSLGSDLESDALCCALQGTAYSFKTLVLIIQLCSLRREPRTPFSALELALLFARLVFSILASPSDCLKCCASHICDPVSSKHHTSSTSCPPFSLPLYGPSHIISKFCLDYFRLLSCLTLWYLILTSSRLLLAQHVVRLVCYLFYQRHKDVLLQRQQKEKIPSKVCWNLRGGESCPGEDKSFWVTRWQAA